MKLILNDSQWSHNITLQLIRFKIFFSMKVLRVFSLYGKREIPLQKMLQRNSFLSLVTWRKNTIYHCKIGSFINQSFSWLSEAKIFIWSLHGATKPTSLLILQWMQTRCVTFEATWSLSQRIAMTVSTILLRISARLPY